MTSRYKSAVAAAPRGRVGDSAPNFDSPSICGKSFADPECIECNGSGTRKTHPAGATDNCFCLDTCALLVDHVGACDSIPF